MIVPPLFATPSEFLSHSRMREVWGKELPHVVREVYGVEAIPGKNSRLTFLSWLRLLLATSRYRGGMPYEYVWGHTRFRGRDFLVSPAVLIPRPETEEWVGRVIEDIGDTGKGLRILDIGTGSGVIALSLAAAFPEAEVTAVEVSRPALRLARKNALAHPSPPPSPPRGCVSNFSEKTSPRKIPSWRR